MILERLSFICKEENVKCDDKTLNTLVEMSGGDMRKAITSLQSCAKLKGSGNPISIENVLEVTGVGFIYLFFKSMCLKYCFLIGCSRPLANRIFRCL
jgi:DNA polymerase III delta prime subunit